MIPPVKYTFGQYQLDTGLRALSRDGEIIPLTRKRYEILQMLIEKAGQVVRKEEIMDRIWAGQAVEEGNLTQHIFYLRRTLGDDSNSPSYILTVPGVGYLFYQPVQATNEEGHTKTIGGFQGNGPIPSRPALQTAEAPAEPPAIPRRPRLSSPYVIALLLVLILSALLFWWRTDKQRTGSTPPVEPIVTVPGAKGDLRFSNDGRYLAFTSEGETVDSRNIFVKPVDSNDILQLTNNAYTDHSLTWSPDNRRIAFLREGPLTSRKNQILIVAATGGKEEVVGKAWHGLDWSPDGQSLAVCDSNGQGEPTGIHLLSLSSGQLRPISRPPPRENIFDGDPKFSPDGRSLAFTRWTSSTTGDLFITDLRTGSLRQLTFDRCRLGSIQWSSEGKELLFVSNRTGNYRVWRIPFRGGEAIPVEGVLGEVDRLSLVDNPRNERLLAYTQRYDDINIQVNSITEQGGANVPAPPCSINSTRADHSPQFSPDGTKIAFMSARTGREEIWIANADCSGVQQLTRFNEDGVGSPRWSPDGRKIAFDRHVGEQSEIFVIETNTGQVQRITDHPSADMLPAWSSDGQQLFFFSERNNASEIWKVSANGGEPTPVTRYGGRESWAASNGRDLFYTSYNSLWLKNLITNDELQISDLKGVLFGRYWTVQGTGVYYLTRETRSRCLIHRYDTQTRQTRVILELPNSPARFVPGFSISPDNSRIAISLISYNPGDISLIRGWN